MKRKNLKGYAAVVALVAAALGGCGAVSEPPVSVEIEQEQGFGPYLKVTSVVKEVTVTDITVNRGNCDVTGYAIRFMGSGPDKGLPITLKFGEYIRQLSCDNLIETTIATNKGDFVFNFQQ